LLSAGWLLASPNDVQAAAQTKTISLVIHYLENAAYATQAGEKEECPDGLAKDAREAYVDSLPPSKAAAYKALNFLQAENYYKAYERGPNGEDVCYRPELIKDPPMPIFKGKLSYGMNLDGEDRGQATPNSCPHENFVTPSGETGIDNQLHRLTGCMRGTRPDGGNAGAKGIRLLYFAGTAYAMEITGVEDERNSPDVTVTLTRVLDPLYRTGDADVLPWASYRIDRSSRDLIVMKGRIADGVLTTDPAPQMRLPHFQLYSWMVKRFRDARFRLKLTADGAAGSLDGYWNLDNLLPFTGGASCPALYQAALQLADGYPDPKTGRCTALSFSYEVKAVKAFFSKTDESDASGSRGRQTVMRLVDAQQGNR
jgi:hypothetical protein